MQLTLYPNNEVRVTWGSGYVTPRADEIRENRGASPLLDIPSQPSQAKPRREYRRHPLRRKAVHRLYHHGALFSDSRKDRQCFLTGTLPGSTDASMVEFTRLAPFASKLVQTYLPRRLGVSAREIRYLWVWELQKRGALHMHLAVECPSEEMASSLIDEWRGIWVDVLRAASVKADCDLFEKWYGGTHKDDDSVWQVDAQRVKKSIGRYLSKYTSKGSNGDSRFFPPRWYGISSRLRSDFLEWVKSNTRQMLGMIDPSVSVSVARLVVGDLLKEFCVGDVSHKHGWGDIGGVDVFGYLKEGKGLEQVWDYVSGLVSHLGMIKRKQIEVKKMADFGNECRMMSRLIESTMPPDEFNSFKALLTEELWVRFSDRRVAGINEYKQGYWAFTLLMHQRGVKWVASPFWATILSEDWSNSRAKFADNLDDELV